jgi:hypothetical protein
VLCLYMNFQYLDVVAMSRSHKLITLAYTKGVNNLIYTPDVHERDLQIMILI